MVMSGDSSQVWGRGNDEERKRVSTMEREGRWLQEQQDKIHSPLGSTFYTTELYIYGKERNKIKCQ